MKEGDSVAMTGPLGTFTIRPSRGAMIWVATGTGIAPFRSMWMADRLTRGVTLIYGARYETGLLYHDEWKSAKLDFRPTLSRPPDGWTGRTGHVQSHVVEAIGESRDVDVYICGLKAMVNDVRAKLKQMGFDRKQIVYEKYD
jgi:CDP-4-dehydro-6-deoxyglucose reductase